MPDIHIELNIPEALEILAELIITGTADDITRKVANTPGLALALLNDMRSNWNRPIYDCLPVLEAIRTNIFEDATAVQLNPLEIRLATISSNAAIASNRMAVASIET